MLEALLVLTLLAFVVPGLWTVVSRHRVAAGRISARAEALEGVRTISWLIPRELAMGAEGVDWTASAETLSLRAFRGFAVIDSIWTTTGEIPVCYAGVRAPDPRKDSVLILGASGHWTSAELTNRIETDSLCHGTGVGGEAELWQLDPAPPSGLVLRLFERGSYHWSDGALRYRRGEGGRQPLTTEIFESGAFLSPAEGAAVFGWKVQLEDPFLARRSGEQPRPFRAWRGSGR